MDIHRGVKHGKSRQRIKKHNNEKKREGKTSERITMNMYYKFFQNIYVHTGDFGCREL